MANVLDAILDAVDEVWVDLGPVTRTVSYRSSGPSTYDVTTGAVGKPFTAFSLPVFVVGYDLKDIDNDRIRVGDKRLLVNRKMALAAASAASTSFVPKNEDRVIVDNVEMQVLDFKLDPAQATVELHVRRAA